MRETLQVVWMALRLAARAGGWRVPAIALCRLALGLHAPVGAVGLKLIADGALQGERGSVVVGAALSAALVAVMFGAYGISVPLETTATERAENEFERDLMRVVSEIPTLEVHERPDLADRLDVLRTNAGALIRTVWAAMGAVSFFAGAGMALLLLLRTDPRLLVLPAFGLPLLAATRYTAVTRLRAEEAAAEAKRRARHLFLVSTSPRFAKELRVFSLHRPIQHRLEASTKAADAVTFAAELRAGVATAAAWSGFMIGWMAAVLFLVGEARRGAASVGDVILAISVAGLVQGYVAGASGIVRELTTTLATARHYVGIRDFAASVDSMRGTGEPPTRLDAGIDLEGVSFVYPGTDREVLRDVTLRVPAGSTVAVVGDNGAGKTTLVKLLLGLYRPTTGVVRVDGSSMADLADDRWHRRHAAAFQDFLRPELTVREAIGLGNPDDVHDDGALRAAAGRAGATIPPLDTQLGTAWGGVELSGGQWQQLALARGMLRPAPLLRVLDEPTASLDAEVEHRLFERYRDAADDGRDRGGVTVLVSHRFSTVTMADLIVVVAEGRVAERGTHAELLALDGLYRELYELQAGAYR